MELPLYQVDAFTDRAFGGNPAAVCLLPRAALPLGDAARQAIAAEMNLSETAFLECSGDENSHGGGATAADDFARCARFRLRWFTPTTEVPLCGHATLAAAAALLQGEGSTVDELRFDTLSGELVVRRGEVDTAAAASLLCMDFPLVPASAEEVPPGLGPGSDLVKAVVGDLPVEDVRYAPSLRYLLVALREGSGSAPGAARAALERLQPDPQRLLAAYGGGKLGVIVTARGDGAPYDFHSRFFAPSFGIPEDPVTGSSHSVLGPFWAARLGRPRLRARQCSARGGDLRLAVDEAKGRVEIAGHAVLVLRGRLLLPPGADC